MLRRLFISSFLFLSSILIFSPIANADSNLVISEEEKVALEKTIDSISFALIDQDVDELMELTHLAALFQFEKKQKLSSLLASYKNSNFIMTGVEAGQMKKVKPDEVKVMVKVYLSAGDAIGGLGAAPRSEIWRFGKDFEGKERGKWFLLVE